MAAFPPLLRHLFRFNTVGAMGIVLQLAVLWILNSLAGLHYLTATALAVEAAVLHNFFWHEYWTWRDRTGASPHGRWRRLLLFQLTNGTVSLLGNLVFMTLFAGWFQIPPLPANLASITSCWLLNFLSSDRLVFRTRKPPAL